MMFGIEIIPVCAALLFCISILLVIIGLLALSDGDFIPLIIGIIGFAGLFTAKYFGVY